jgi:hypothetical protein
MGGTGAGFFFFAYAVGMVNAATNMTTTASLSRFMVTSLR